MQGGADEAGVGGPGQQGFEESARLGAAVFVDAAPYVSLKVDEGSVANTGFTHLRDRLEGVGQGFAVGVVGGPHLAEALGDAAGADYGEGEGKTTLEGSARLLI